MSTDRYRHGRALLLVLTEGLGAWPRMPYRARVSFAVGQSPRRNHAGDKGPRDVAGAGVRSEARTVSVFQRPLESSTDFSTWFIHR